MKTVLYFIFLLFWILNVSMLLGATANSQNHTGSPVLVTPFARANEALPDSCRLEASVKAISRAENSPQKWKAKPYLVQKSNTFKPKPQKNLKERWKNARPFVIFFSAVVVCLFIVGLIIVAMLGLPLTAGNIFLAFAGLLIAFVVLFLAYLIATAFGFSF